MKLLVTWVGHTDLRAFAAEADDGVRTTIADAIGRLEPVPEGSGPVRGLLEAHTFDRVVILGNYSNAVMKAYVDWLPVDAECRQVRIQNPTDYGEVFRIADDALKAVSEEMSGREYELCIHLSPGTPAMAAVWVLLGKTHYPATFYQSDASKAWVTEIPFDLVIDVVPELLRGADSRLQHLATSSPADVPGFEHIAGKSQAIRLAVGRARKAAIRDVPVLLLGESGSGKEMFAQAIHAASHRRDKPFETINCAALPGTLLESELFGHEKGAFTGASSQFRGAFERADGGTLFLDEIGECSPDLQVKLLRVLQPPGGASSCTRVLRRLGSQQDLQVDVRVVAATNQDLISRIPKGAFREDLFYRLAVITLRLPALRERKTDIPIIATALLAKINADFARSEPGYNHKFISDSANSFLVLQRWPGNVRQLYNCLVQAAVMSNEGTLEEEDLREALAEMPVLHPAAQDILECPLDDSFSIEEHLEEVQRHFLRRAMKQAGGTKSKAAKLLGMKNYQTLDAQLKRLNVDWKKV